MNRRAVIIGISIIAAVIVIVLVSNALMKKAVPLKEPLPVVPQKIVNLNKPQILISDEDQRLMGIRKTEINRLKFGKTVKVQGKIDYDSENISEVETNIKGVVESVVAEEGKYIKKGDLLIEINSPEILAAQQELIAATRPGSLSEAEAETARKKLRQMGISDELISQIEKAGIYSRNIKIMSPVTGYIVKKFINKGDSVSEGNKLITIADLSTVMFVGEVADADMPLIKKDEEAEILIDAYPNRIFKTKTETVIPSGVIGKLSKVNMRISNSDNGLRPGMQGSAEIKIDMGTRLAVPLESIIDKDGRKVVFVETGGGKFEARTITTGISFGSQVEVTGGLKEGELVVSSGVTKVDSEAERQKSH
ncbi:MAG TPA: efflux RND transporter periplasmic adaptor subunit [Desulfomonilia bacterium]